MTQHFRQVAQICMLLALFAAAGFPPGCFAASQYDTRVGSIWLSPRDDLPRSGYSGTGDFQDLFQPNAPWQNAAKRVRVFKLIQYFVNKASDDELKTILLDLRRRHIALAIETGMLTNPSLCGRIEGYCGEHTERTVSRLKALGGNLEYVAMDEPLWYGHVSSQPGALHTPITDLAKDVATQVAIIHRYFPHAQVGDIEPITGIAPFDYVAELGQWKTAFERATGTPLAFFHADIAWETNGWPQQLSETYSLMAANGIRFGIIYNGAPDDTTGRQWVRHAVEHFTKVEGDLGLIPDAAIIQTWDQQPDRVLPENQPGTMTNLMILYAAAPSTLSIKKGRNGFEGQLTTAGGSPVANAHIVASIEDDGTLNLTSKVSAGGKVPAKAAFALAAVRLNTECGNCDGPVNIALGPFHYSDDTSGKSVVAPIVPGEKIILTPAESKALNSSKFQVTPRDRFTFSISERVPYSSRHNGFIYLIFLTSAGKELSRVRLPLKPGQQIIGTARTDEHGSFAIPAPPFAPFPAVINFVFDGNDKARSIIYRYIE